MLKIKIDLHVHTKYSDGSGDIKEILIEAYRKNLNGIAITDHNTTVSLKKGKLEKYAKKLGLMIIPGIELKTDAGHILAIGVDVNLDLQKYVRVKYDEVLDWIRGFGGIVVIAHPALEINKSHKWIINKPDALEVFNASYPFKFMVNMVLKINSKIRLPLTAGSDAHNPKCVGNAYTILEVEDMCIEEVLNAIKKGRTKPYGKISPLNNRIKLGLKHLKIM